jgi:membrane associated rhomboid family serine protease
MIPIRDDNPTQITPVVTYALIVANVLVWLWEFSMLQGGHTWILSGYGVVPTRITGDPSGEAFTVLTSMFMHGSWAHLGWNMLFLYIFGDNVEEALGHVRYIAFYLVGGLGAAVAQVAIDPASPVPMVGASGAIAGVLGAYLVLYPRAPVVVINPIFPLWFILGIFLVFPAWLVVGEWFLGNLLAGLGSLGRAGQGGVAFFAHIGGFVVGLLLIRPALIGRQKRPARRWTGWRPPPRSGGGGAGGWRPPRDPRSRSSHPFWH